MMQTDGAVAVAKPALDLKASVAAVRAKAAEMPDKIYKIPTDDDGTELECVYVERDGKGDLCGSCLVGHGLIDAGVPLGFLDRDVISINALLFTEWNVVYETPESQWLQVVQEAQDQHKPWAEAVRLADEAVKLGV